MNVLTGRPQALGLAGFAGLAGLTGLARLGRLALLSLALLGSPAASAEAEGEFQVDSAAVVAISKSLAFRYAQMKPYFQEGVIGFTHDGLIALREANELTKDLRAEVELFIAEDNKERRALYREIARANGHPDWESKFQFVFADRWIRRSPVGWYYRDSSGNWIKKIAALPE